MTEECAKDITGVFLYNPIKDKYWFRIYNQQNRREYKDYRLGANDIEVTILAGGLSLFRCGVEKNYLDWSSKYLHLHHKRHEGEESSAKDVSGFFISTVPDGKLFFRVYGKDHFDDYEVIAEDIEVKILDENLSFYSEGNKLDWSSKVLGR